MSRVTSWMGSQGECEIGPMSSASQKAPQMGDKGIVPPELIPGELLVRLAEADVALAASYVKSYYSAYHAYVRANGQGVIGSQISYDSFTGGGLSRDEKGAVVSPWTVAQQQRDAEEARVGGYGDASVDDGKCYLDCFRVAERDQIFSELGLWPTIGSVLSVSYDKVDFEALQLMRANPVAGDWHFFFGSEGQEAIRVLRAAAEVHPDKWGVMSLADVLKGEPACLPSGLPGLPYDDIGNPWLVNRPRDAVVASAQAWGGKVRTSSGLSGTLEVVETVFPGEIEPGSLLMAPTRLGVARLQAKFGEVPDVHILTVPQAQGMTFDNVYLFRTGVSDEGLLFDNSSWMLPIFTRHAFKFRYVSGLGADLVRERISVSKNEDLLFAAGRLDEVGVGWEEACSGPLMIRGLMKRDEALSYHDSDVVVN